MKKIMQTLREKSKFLNPGYARNLAILAVLFIVGKVTAQNFEGTIRWSMKMEITDPKQKAQMEQAQKQMNDPATQAKMKEMQAQMNDPQFKAMMESNPQMKAQMEKMMTGMQSGDIGSMMPSGFVVKIKNQNTLTKMEGGMMTSESLYLKDKNQTYSVDRQNKTYSVMTAPTTGNPPSPEPEAKVTKTSETAKILNHTCTKYIVETSINGKSMTQFVWATTELKDFDLKALSKQRFGKGGQRMFYESIDGVPLKMEMTMPEGSMSMEVTEIKKATLDSSDFILPSDFKEVSFIGGMKH